MARLQILELPEGSDDDRPPFVLVVDESSYPTVEAYQAAEGWWQQLAEQIGARGCIVTDDTIDIPANDVPLDPHGYPIKFRIEPDLTGWDDAVAEALANVHDSIGEQFTLKLGDRDIETTVKAALDRQDPHGRA